MGSCKCGSKYCHCCSTLQPPRMESKVDLNTPLINTLTDLLKREQVNVENAARNLKRCQERVDILNRRIAELDQTKPITGGWRPPESIR